MVRIRMLRVFAINTSGLTLTVITYMTISEVQKTHKYSREIGENRKINIQIVGYRTQ